MEAFRERALTTDEQAGQKERAAVRADKVAVVDPTAEPAEPEVVAPGSQSARAVEAPAQATPRAASSIRDNPFMQGNARPEPQAAVRAGMPVRQVQARCLMAPSSPPYPPDQAPQPPPPLSPPLPPSPL